MAKQLSLPVLPQVTRGMTWANLFGRSIDEVTPQTRRSRWEELKQLATEVERSAMVEVWENCERRDCRHFCGGWCERQGLPSAFNPITKITGMACMGFGYQAKGGA